MNKNSLMRDDLFRGGSLIFLGMMTGSVFGYMFQITMGRMLPVRTFGEMNALFAIMIIFGVPFSSITNFLARRISGYQALSLPGSANDMIIRSYKNLLAPGAAIFLAGALLSKDISGYLKMQSMIPVVLLFLSVFVSVAVPVNTGILQGLRKFGMLSFVSAGSGVFKYVFCLVLVLMGMKLNGVMAGTILSVIVVGGLSFIPIGRHLRLGRVRAERPEGEVFNTVIPILLANLSFALLSQVDMVAVKYFFTPREAGLYSSAAIIGKTVMYIPGAIVVSLFPLVASNRALNIGTLHLLLKALGLTILLSGGGAAVLYFFPGPVVSFFFGSRFAPAVHVVGFFAVAMMPLAVISVIMNYNMARGGRYFSYVMLLCSMTQAAGMMLFHADVMDILRVIFYTGLICMAALFSLLAAEYYRGKARGFVPSAPPCLNKQDT